MQVDAFTILLFGLFIKAMLGALFFVFWLNDRRNAVWFLWWSATFALGSLSACLFLLRGFGAEFLSVGIGVASLLAAFACAWQGARAFDRRPALWLPVVLPPALWLVACLLPNFLDTTGYRVVLSSAMLAPLVGMCAVEFWRGRQEPLQSRWPVMILFASLASFFAARILLVHTLPFPFGALPTEPGWMAAFNLIIFFHALMLSVLLVAISKERLELDQRMKAQTDPLTGALNRRAFMARGTRLVQRHCHERAPLCLLFLDLDHFKALNDRLGHSGGDDVLMKFVAVVHDNIRPTDFLFRIGGEEFCCLLPNTSADQAHIVAERIRHQFENATVDIAGTLVKSTVCIGIASTETFGYDLDVLMRKADMAVYAAKRQGRNLVVNAAPDEPVTAVSNVTVLDGRMAPAA